MTSSRLRMVGLISRQLPFRENRRNFCLCVCVCARERVGEEGEREGGRVEEEGERGRVGE